MLSKMAQIVDGREFMNKKGDSAIGDNVIKWIIYIGIVIVASYLIITAVGSITR